MQLKNGLLEVLELVALFLLKTGTCDAKNTLESFSYMLYFAFLRFVLKRERQIQSNISLMNRSSNTAYSITKLF